MYPAIMFSLIFFCTFHKSVRLGVFYNSYFQGKYGCKDQESIQSIIPHLTQDTNGKGTNSYLDTTNESQEVGPFPAGDHKAQINRRTQRHKDNLQNSSTIPGKRHFFQIPRPRSNSRTFPGPNIKTHPRMSFYLKLP